MSVNQAGIKYLFFVFGMTRPFYPLVGSVVNDSLLKIYKSYTFYINNLQGLICHLKINQPELRMIKMVDNSKE